MQMALLTSSQTDSLSTRLKSSFVSLIMHRKREKNNVKADRKWGKPSKNPLWWHSTVFGKAPHVATLGEYWWLMILKTKN